MKDLKLNHFESAVFLARMEYPNCKKKIIIKYPFQIKNHNEKYTDKYRIKRWQKENQEIDFVIDYLEKYYPNTDYANRFMEWQGNEWRQLLRFPTEKSKKCDCHFKDEFHCNLERQSGCMTCCFVCYSPELCKWAKCILLTN